MTTIDYSARLAKVQAAIDAILDGKMTDYELDGQRVSYLNLADLQKEEQRLVAKINRQTRRGRAFKTAVPR